MIKLPFSSQPQSSHQLRNYASCSPLTSCLNAIINTICLGSRILNVLTPPPVVEKHTFNA